MNKNNLIKEHRREIDKIHQKLILFIAKRNNVFKKISKLKNELKLPRIDIAREKQMINDARETAGKLDINEKIVIKIIKILIRKNLGKRLK